ncbi:MAG TPA: PHP domain-containing protein [Candidatus Bathyarchaeota archaeon]|nr:PHP domain-containing protein [Candidatus Bathyarchaeota archaeon]
MLKLDLHVHSAYSRDSKSSLEEINEAARHAGLDGYALVDHDTVEGLEPALESAGDLLVVPGVEVTARGCHILALGVQERVQPGMNMAETVDQIHGLGGLAVLAHPYGMPTHWFSLRMAPHAGFDAVEVVNSAQFPCRLVQWLNRRLADRLGLPGVGGSDSHIPSTVGRAYTLVDARERTVEGVLEAIKEGRVRSRGSCTTGWERLVKVWRQLVWRANK